LLAKAEISRNHMPSGWNLLDVVTLKLMLTTFFANCKVEDPSLLFCWILLVLFLIPVGLWRSSSLLEWEIITSFQNRTAVYAFQGKLTCKHAPQKLQTWLLLPYAVVTGSCKRGMSRRPKAGAREQAPAPGLDFSNPERPGTPRPFSGFISDEGELRDGGSDSAQRSRGPALLGGLRPSPRTPSRFCLPGLAAPWQRAGQPAGPAGAALPASAPLGPAERGGSLPAPTRR